MSEERIADVVDLFTGTPLTHVYSRTEAIADGTLVDVSRMAAALGYRTPVALSRAAYAAMAEGADDPAVRSARAHHVLQMGLFAVAALSRGAANPTAEFECYPGGRVVTLRAHVGPGDTIDPVVTLMLPEEK